MPGKAMRAIGKERTKRETKTAEDDSVSLFSRWSDIIQRQGKESRARDNETLAHAQATFPAKVKELKTLTNEKLVETYRIWGSTCFDDPRLTMVFMDIAEEAGNEILRRLNNKG